MNVIEQLRGGLIVSCQAYPGEPMRDPRTMAQIAQACAAGGAAAVRVQGVDDILHTVSALSVPVIGLIKEGTDGVFITPTLQHALQVIEAGAHVVALDGTRRPRPDGATLAETIARLRERVDVCVMADCGSLEDAIAAAEAGADVIGTTLAGYTGDRRRTKGPDLELIEQVVSAVPLPVIAEGRIHTTDQAAAAMRRGAHAVCVGTAITHPSTITSWFAQAIGLPQEVDPAGVPRHV